uniref:Uncharacterized protein n=1 Tax=Populus trichocarpa TaxID=3694 RepID=A0A2K2ATS3_POPTR
MPCHMWKIKMAIGALLALKRLQMQAIKLVEEEYGGKVTFSKEDIQGRESSANSCSFECLAKVVSQRTL